VTAGFFSRIRSSIYRSLGRPDGPVAVFLLGHRSYVGGAWDEIGRLQADFMLAMGLSPDHVFLDVACGALRCGVHLIPYLNRGNYLGLDREARLVRLGIRHELGTELYRLKAPEFLINSEFEFDRFSKKPDFALAQSLFTHLNREDILRCLANLRAFAKPGTRFFATYFIGDRQMGRRESHALRRFTYTREQSLEFGEQTGWKARYIGDWNHPRHQMMLEYSAE
jgi:hypothetical protein